MEKICCTIFINHEAKYWNFFVDIYRYFELKIPKTSSKDRTNISMNQLIVEASGGCLISTNREWKD